MGVHYRKEVKTYQVIVVLCVVFFIMLGINHFAFLSSLKMYGLLLAVVALMSFVSLGVLYLFSSMANISGLKEGTKVTSEREDKELS